MKMLAMLILVLVVYTAAADDYYSAEGGPRLVASSTDARLDIGRTGSVWVTLENVGDVTGMKPKERPSNEGEEMLALLEQDLEMGASEAMGIEARLRSEDGGITVISGPQPGGSLSRGQRLERPLEFQVEVDADADAGTCLFTLTVEYERLKNVMVGGDPRYPKIRFQKEPAEETTPIEVSIFKGPRIMVAGGGEASPGEGFTLDVVLTNRGDKSAREMQITLIPQAPFIWAGDPAVVDDLGPGGSAEVEFAVQMAGDVDPGDYAIIVQVRYRTGDEIRTEVSAALVAVGNSGESKVVFVLPVLVVLVVLSVVLSIVLYLGVRDRRLPWKRKRWW
ncbi:MAG: COG1361 S-layer family protein [Methanotrichaceae archaeon]